MELLGYLPVRNEILTAISPDIRIYENKIYVEGKELDEKNKFSVILKFRCISQAEVPNVEELVTPQMFDRFTMLSRGINISTNSNLDILTHDSFTLIDKNEAEVIIPANALAGVTIVNCLENAEDSTRVEQIKDKALAELEKINLPDLDWDNIFKRRGENYADVYLTPDFSKITDGVIQKEQFIDISGITINRQVWKGNYPLDKFIYVLQSNLDILLANKNITSDMYGNLYATLFQGALQSATILEQARIQAYEQASQFQIKTLVEYYLGVITAKLNTLKSLADYDLALLNKGILKAQVKLYTIQTQGFRTNNVNKLFQAQLDGASTAFSAGMLEEPPAVYNQAELASLYTNVASSMF